MTKNLQNTLTKEMLEYEYNNLGSMQKIADKLNYSIDSIYKYMKLYSIPYNSHYKGIYSCNHNLFSEENEASFYLAGFIAADGSLQKRKYSKILKITLSLKDLSHLEKIKSALDADVPIKHYIVNPTKLVKTQNKCVEIQIVSNKIFDDLSKFNIVPNKTFIYDMPEWLINHKLVHHFMRGYFDGDGSVSFCGLGKNRTIKQLYFTMIGTEAFVNQYQSVLLANNIVNKNKITKRANIFYVGYSGNNNAKNLYNFLYKDATIFLDRKESKFHGIDLVATYSPDALDGDLQII